jgi:hypothetical protein
MSVLPTADFRLWSAQHNGQYLFVSNDMAGADHVVEAHPFGDEERNYFRAIEEADFRVRLFHPATGTFLFVSNDMAGPDHVVEAHFSADEERNRFEVGFSADGQDISFFNTATHTAMFLSNDQRGDDYVIEAHVPASSEVRNLFRLA